MATKRRKRALVKKRISTRRNISQKNLSKITEASLSWHESRNFKAFLKSFPGVHLVLPRFLISIFVLYFTPFHALALTNQEIFDIYQASLQFTPYQAVPNEGACYSSPSVFCGLHHDRSRCTRFKGPAKSTLRFYSEGKVICGKLTGRGNNQLKFWWQRVQDTRQIVQDNKVCFATPGLFCNAHGDASQYCIESPVNGPLKKTVALYESGETLCTRQTGAEDWEISTRTKFIANMDITKTNSDHLRPERTHSIAKPDPTDFLKQRDGQVADFTIDAFERKKTHPPDRKDLIVIDQPPVDSNDEASDEPITPPPAKACEELEFNQEFSQKSCRQALRTLDCHNSELQKCLIQNPSVDCDSRMTRNLEFYRLLESCSEPLLGPPPQLCRPEERASQFKAKSDSPDVTLSCQELINSFQALCQSPTHKNKPTIASQCKLIKDQCQASAPAETCVTSEEAKKSVPEKLAEAKDRLCHSAHAMNRTLGIDCDSKLIDTLELPEETASQVVHEACPRIRFDTGVVAFNDELEKCKPGDAKTTLLRNYKNIIHPACPDVFYSQFGQNPPFLHRIPTRQALQNIRSCQANAETKKYILLQGLFTPAPHCRKMTYLNWQSPSMVQELADCSEAFPDKMQKAAEAIQPKDSEIRYQLNKFLLGDSLAEFYREENTLPYGMITLVEPGLRLYQQLIDAMSLEETEQLSSEEGSEI